MINPFGLTVTVEDYEDESLQVSFDPACIPEHRESSDGNIELVLPYELIQYLADQAFNALENYEED